MFLLLQSNQSAHTTQIITFPIITVILQYHRTHVDYTFFFIEGTR